MTAPTAHSVRRLLAVRTAVAFAIVAALASLGQGLVQRDLAGLRAGTQVVNVAGRQRMLSQKTTKAALLAVNLRDHAALAEMTDAAARLGDASRMLVDGDAATGLPAASPASATMLRALGPDVEALARAVEGVRAAMNGPGEADVRVRNAQAPLRRLLAAERRFLPAMDRAVGRLDAEVEARVQALRRLCLALFGLMMASLGLVFVALVRPAARQAAQALLALEGRNASLGTANDALDAARASAVEAERVKADFLASMSHEIRTPLNGVVGMAALLGGTDLSETQAEFVRTIRLSADALMLLLNDVLDLSKIEAGRIDLEQEPFSLEGLIADALDIVAPGAARSSVELVASVAESVPPMVVGDPTRVRQVLLNLLSNAVKFTDAGEVEVSASAEPEADRMRVSMSVRDTGTGIAPERLEALFEPFTQAARSTTRTHGGTGLGLSIARRLAERMGGDVFAASIPGQGSTFSATFTVGTTDMPGPGAPDRLLAGRHVLVVDDNAANRRVVSTLVARWGGTPHVFASAEAALGVLPTRLDVAILDVRMDGMSGTVLARALAHARPDTPVLLLSSLDSTDVDVPETVASTMIKPVRPARLRAALAQALPPAEETRLGAADATVSDQPAPISEMPAAEESDAEESDAEESDAEAPRGLRLLLAEDDPTNQRVALRMLERLGLDADVADDGEAAVAQATAIAYDVVLMDVEMPRMGGIEALRALRMLLPRESQPHVLALTGHVDPGARARLAAAGFDGYLPKPLDLDALARALAAAPTLAAAPAPPTPPPGAAFVARPRPMPDAETLRARLRAHVADLIGEDDPEFVADLSTTFTTTATRLLSDARATRDAAALKAIAHQMRGSAANIGLTDLAAAWERVETGADVAERLDAAAAETERAVEALAAVAG